MARYPESKAIRTGRSLLATRNRRSSDDLSDLEVITVLTGSEKFAQEFCAEFGGAGGLRNVRSPHDLLRLPSATEAIVGKMYSSYEVVARVISGLHTDQSGGLEPEPDLTLSG
jgi:hypothetical protein